uniref:Uncharacterized protein n=1 Tax=Hordeum vulgare subsp. vulgare TaxID=112509 RepID=A0A8I6Y336_HORVV
MQLGQCLSALRCAIMAGDGRGSCFVRHARIRFCFSSDAARRGGAIESTGERTAARLRFRPRSLSACACPARLRRAVRVRPRHRLPLRIYGLATAAMPAAPHANVKKMRPCMSFVCRHCWILGSPNRVSSMLFRTSPSLPSSGSFLAACLHWRFHNTGQSVH